MDTENFSHHDTYFAADIPSEDVRVKIIGVGGAGTNAVDRLQLDSIERVRLAAINTDASALANSPLQEKCMIGRSVTRGLSAGGEVEIGRKAALSDRDKITSLIGSANLVFLVAGLGGGTGSGAMPVVAELAAERGALVVAFVTLPFTMEGSRRQAQAQEALVELRQLCDAVIPIPNDLLLQDVDEQATVLNAFAHVDAWISRGIRSICTMLFNTGIINLDFGNLRQAFISRGGKTLFGLGRAEGASCAQAAIEDLFMCPLLHLPESATCADRLLVNIIGGTDMTLARVNEIITTITDRFNSRDSTIIGAVVDEQMCDSLEICVIGTTDLSNSTKRVRTSLPSARPQTPQKAEDPVLPPPADDEDVEAEVSVVALPQNTQESPAESAPRAQVPVHVSKLVGRKAASVPENSQEEFTFVRKEEQRGYFDNTERNLYDGQDLDVPTYLRRGIRITIQ